MFTRARHWSLFRDKWIHTLRSYLRCNLILSSHLRVCYLNGLFAWGFRTETLFSYFMRATCPSHSIILDLIIQVISAEGYKLRSSTLYIFLHPPVTSFLLSPNAPSLCSSRNVRDQVSCPYKTLSNIRNGPPAALYAYTLPDSTYLYERWPSLRQVLVFLHYLYFTSIYSRSSLVHHSLYGTVSALLGCTFLSEPWPPLWHTHTSVLFAFFLDFFTLRSRQSFSASSCHLNLGMNVVGLWF
jgi:hypothetical protein